MKILFATTECAPYVKVGGLGDVSAALPAALGALGHDVRILLPAYSGVRAGAARGAGVELPPSGPWPAARLEPVAIAPGVTLLLLACPSLYERPGGPYVDAGGRDYPDNALRFGLLARVAALLGTADTPLGDWRADVVHANDWPSAMAALYLARARMASPGQPAAASVLTIHNLAFQGLFPMESAGLLGVPPAWRGADGVELWGKLSMLKAGIRFADAIATVSPSYAREIRRPAQGAGLDALLRARARSLRGILNGIDTQLWNPATDALLPATFGPGDMGGKAQCKAALQARLALPQDPGAMLFGMVCRLTEQKGVDLVLGALARLLAAGAQLAVLGQGDPALQKALQDACRRHPKQVAVHLGFDEGLAHLIEAGADAFLMPSRFEPCGLNQMYSQVYGTPPVVAPVGGLLDSVTDASADPRHGTGFVMAGVGLADLEDAIARALRLWRQPQRWRRIQANGMARDFGWAEGALQYLQAYRSALRRARTRRQVPSQAMWDDALVEGE